MNNHDLIAVSMCNQLDKNKSGLVAVNLSSGDMNWITTGVQKKWWNRPYFAKQENNGCTGIAATKRYLFVYITHKFTYISGCSE